MGRTSRTGCVKSDEDIAYLETIMHQFYPNGRKKCDACRTLQTYQRVPGRTAYACQRCRHQFFPLAGTIFEGSKTSLALWFKASYVYSSDFLIPAALIKRQLGVTYKTAWQMLSSIRSLGTSVWICEMDLPKAEFDAWMTAKVVAEAKKRGHKAVPDHARKIGVAEVVPHRFPTANRNAAEKVAEIDSKTSDRKTIDADKVKKLAGMGFPVETIASLLNCKRQSLLRYYEKEIAAGRLAAGVTGRRGQRKYTIKNRRPPWPPVS